jgi:predicted ester cyclase
MSLAENKAIAQRFIDTFNTDDPRFFDDLCRPDIAKMMRDVMTTLPFTEHRVEITQMVAEDDRVMVWLATSGVHSAEWEGVPATGKRWTNTGAWFFRIENGTIVEVDALFDELGHLKQLGATVTAPVSNV